MTMTAVYPGTFDPITMGHVDIARRAAQIFEHVIVAVYDTPAKTLVFDTAERVAMAEKALAGVGNIEVRAFGGLLVEFARQAGARVIVRGLRAVSDYEIETQMALMNRTLAPEVEEVFLVASLQYSFLSASLIKEVIKLGGTVEGLVPDFVADALRQKLAKQEETAPVPRWLTS
ncbi:MAG TPA: pantetheine-phosphate adenylyltransferase [Chloroflexota bacterium]|nr:pantetheine-phosphate adenylyltransferase [Chloroflexota bacterium]